MTNEDPAAPTVGAPVLTPPSGRSGAPRTRMLPLALRDSLLLISVITLGLDVSLISPLTPRLFQTNRSRFITPRAQEAHALHGAALPDRPPDNRPAPAAPGAPCPRPRQALARTRVASFCSRHLGVTSYGDTLVNSCSLRGKCHESLQKQRRGVCAKISSQNGLPGINGS